MITSTKRALPLLAIALLCSAGAARADDDPASLSLIHPATEINGVKIKHITATLDGFSFGDCWLDRPLKDDVCIEERDIDAGPHKLELILDPLTSTFFRASVSFTAGAHGDWVLDVRKMVAANARQEEYLVLQGKLAPVEGCVPAVEHIAELSSCHVDGLKAVAQAFDAAARACHSVGKDERDAFERALYAAFDAHFGLSLEQCYDAKQIESLPGRITERWIGRSDGAWPPNSLEESSWRWARDVLPKKKRHADKTEMDALDVALQAMPLMARRLEVVDGVIQAYLAKGPKPVLQAAQKQPWSLDPTTPEGHRNILVLTDPEFFYDDAYADFAAGKVAADASLDCSRYDWEARNILDYFTAHETLSPAAWQAAAAMMERVPPDGSFDTCRPAFDPKRKSPIAVSERLHLLVKLDCASTRTAEARGQWLKQILRKDGNRMAGVDFDLRDQLRTEFAACLDAK